MSRKIDAATSQPGSSPNRSPRNCGLRSEPFDKPAIRDRRSYYGDSQEFHFTGPWGENGWLEDYIARVDDKPLGCVVLVTRNATEQTQHVVASYRPVSTVIHFSRLLHEKFAGTPYAKHFLGGE